MNYTETMPRRGVKEDERTHSLGLPEEYGLDPFRMIADTLPLGIALADSAGRHIYLNARFTEIFGYDIDDVPDRDTFLEKIYPDPVYRESVVLTTWSKDSQSFHLGKTRHREFVAKCRNGSMKIIDFLCVQISSGEIFLTCEDVTQHKLTQEALLRNEKRYRLIFEKSVDPILVTNGRYFTDCNEAALNIMGFPSKEALREVVFSDLLPEVQPDGRQSRALAEEVIRTTLYEGSARVEWVARTMRGNTIWMDTSLTKISLPGEVSGIHTVWRDITERKMAEEKIEHLSSFPRLNPNPVLELSWDGEIRFFNDAAVEMLQRLGFREDMSFFLPPDIKDILQNIKASGGEQYYREMVLGEALIGISIYPVKQFDAVHVYISDITERKRTEKALIKSEDKAKRIFDNIPLPTLVYDQESLEVVDVNQAALKHYGYSRDEFLTMALRDLMVASDKDIVKEYGETSSVVITQKGLWRHRTKDGHIIDVEVTGDSLNIPDKPYGVIVANDVTEKRRAEEALRFTQFAVDHAAVGITWVGKEGHILYINEETCRSLGYTRRELLSMMACDINPVHPWGSWDRIWRNVKRLGSVTIETVYRKRNQETFPVELTANYMEYDGNGYLCTIVRDITERKGTEEALKKREEELQVESKRLAEANTALKVLLKHREDDRKDLENKFLTNLKQLVYPYLDNLKKSRLDLNQSSNLDIIETNLNNITSPFLQRMSLKFINFTHTEVQVANLIKNGKTTKEISDILKVSTGTIDTHRNSIRRKLGLNKEKINLRAYLQSLA